MNLVEQAARRVAEAERVYDAVTAHVRDWKPDQDLSLYKTAWAWGSSMPGHDELAHLVHRRITADIHKHVQGALEDARQELHKARRGMWAALESIRA